MSRYGALLWLSKELRGRALLQALKFDSRVHQHESVVVTCAVNDVKKDYGTKQAVIDAIR
jgi:hypothetical protein